VDDTGKDPSRDRRGPSANPAYWIVAGSLVVVGFLTGFSIGIPLLALGLALIALAPVRDRPATFWPPLAAVVFFFLGYVLAAPLECTTSVVSSAAPGSHGPIARGHTVCTNVLGLDYSGGEHYSPSLLPALVAGVAAAAIAWALFRWLGRRTAARRQPAGGGARGGNGPSPRAAWWVVAGGFLGLSVIGWLEGILSFLVALAMVTRLGARRTPGWPLVLLGAGIGSVWWTLLLWIDPACQRASAFGRAGHQVVEQCFERAPAVWWPAAVSVGLIVAGAVLYLRQRKQASSPVS